MLALGAVAWFFNAPAQAQVVSFFNVDNFTNPVGFILTQNGPGINSALQTGLGGTNTIGGQRIVAIEFTTGTGTSDINNTNVPGQLSVNLDNTANGRGRLYYGYDNYVFSNSNPAAPVHTFNDLNANVFTGLGLVNGSNALFDLRFTVYFDDLGGTMTAKLVSGRGTPSQQVAQVTVNLPFLVPSVNPVQDVIFTRGAFEADNPNINWSDIDQIVLETSDGPTGRDLRIDNLGFATVPEPMTMTLLGFSGAFSWLSRRWRRQWEIENQIADELEGN
jgi:hypothetical protein